MIQRFSRTSAKQLIKRHVNPRFTQISYLLILYAHFNLFITANYRCSCSLHTAWFNLTSSGRGVQHEKGTEHLSVLGFDGVQLKQRFQDQSVQLFQPQHLNCKEQRGRKREKILFLDTVSQTLYSSPIHWTHDNFHCEKDKEEGISSKETGEHTVLHCRREHLLILRAMHVLILHYHIYQSQHYGQG